MAMSRDKLIIGGVVVLAALSFFVYSQAKRDESIGKPTVTAADFPTISASDDIDKVSLTNGDKPEVVLQKVPDSAAAPQGDGGAPTKWELAKPVKAEVNQQTAKDLVNNLTDLKVDAKINLILDDAVRKDKQLDTAHAVHVVAWKGGDKKIDEFFGKSGSAGQLVVVADKPEAVWAAKGYSAFLYSKEAKDFRNKEIVHFDDASATQATITNTHGAFSFTKSGDKWAATFDRKPLARLDEEKIKDMLRAYKVLSADDFGDGKSLEETGLDKPDARLSITLKDDKTVEVLVGKASTGANRWAKRADSDLIYQIPGFAADWVTSDVSKYQASADAGAAKPPAKTAAKNVGKK
jgi:hypothetical protein